MSDETVVPRCPCGGRMSWRHTDRMRCAGVCRNTFVERQLECPDCGSRAVVALFPRDAAKFVVLP